MPQTATTTIPDSVKADPQHYKIEFENDKVRVLRVSYGPGETSAMHSHPNAVQVFLTDAHARFIFPDGTSQEVRGKAGQTAWSAAFAHAPENLERTPLELILVELK